MKFSKTLVGVAVFLIGATVFGMIFQNCAKAKFFDPDPVHSALALGLCQFCHDETGSGLACRGNQNSAFSNCVYESCRPGYTLASGHCNPVVCAPGSIANCTVPHGEGRMTCAATENSQTYGPCVANSCEVGYALQGNSCVPVEENPSPSPSPEPEPAPSPSPDPNPQVCEPGSHRDCSTDSTYGTETCNESGTAYGSCTLGDCKPGFNKSEGGACIANVCDPNTITPCTVGAGVGFQTCTSQGAGWGVCEINGCQPGYSLIDGVCVVRICTPGEESVCEFAHGSGLKICNETGTDYGACSLNTCQNGYVPENRQCVEKVCVPASATTCQGESGSGVKYCYENGLGFGPCGLTTCDPGFKLKNGQCVAEDSCDTGETFACTGQNGTGLRACQDNHKIGPCVMTQCNADFELVNQGGSPACKKSK